MTVEEEFDLLVAPYARAAEQMGYRRLERHVDNEMEPPTHWRCVDFYFDDEATFLDLGAQDNIGFCTVQFYTFVRAQGEDHCVITNGTPPGQQRSRRMPLVMLPLIPFINWVESHVPEHARALDMKGAEDLPLVLERHRVALAARHYVIRKPGGDDPLEQRWQWSEIFNE